MLFRLDPSVLFIHILIYVFESDFLIEEIVFWATSWVWLSCSLSKLLVLCEFIDEVDEDEFDLKEMREKDHKR